MDCLFCKIVDGELPAKIEYEDAEVLGFWDIKPSAPVHIIMIPKEHIAGLGDAGEGDVDLLGKLQLAIKKTAKKMGITSGFRVILNAGNLQEVPHIHYHLQGGFGKGGVEE